MPFLVITELGQFRLGQDRRVFQNAHGFGHLQAGRQSTPTFQRSAVMAGLVLGDFLGDFLMQRQLAHGQRQPFQTYTHFRQRGSGQGGLFSGRDGASWSV